MREINAVSINLKLINSKSYKKLYPYLVAGFFISYFLSWLFILPIIIIIGLVALNILIPIYMIEESKNFEEKGRLSMDMENIVIAENLKQPLIVPISMLEDLKISRGATIHVEEKGYPSETNDNWISFTFNQKLYNFEFCIVDKKENENFELMINGLRSTYSKFYYESI